MARGHGWPFPPPVKHGGGMKEGLFQQKYPLNATFFGSG